MWLFEFRQFVCPINIFLLLTTVNYNIVHLVPSLNRQKSYINLNYNIVHLVPYLNRQKGYITHYIYMWTVVT